MSTNYLNSLNISPLLSAWLAYDDYDYNTDPKTISVTTLLKPIRPIIIALQNKDCNKLVDVKDLIATSMGTALHDSVEKAWKSDKLQQTLLNLGYPEKLVKAVVVNPSEVKPGQIPIYIEQRHQRELNGWKISGKFDAVMDGRVMDIKSTSVWSHIFGSNNEKYIQQGSIYRWIVPSIITQDILQIEHIFTDWSSVQSLKNSQYPPNRLMSKEFQLMSIDDTEKFISDKLALIDKYLTVDETALPECTDEELWREPTTWKYYKANKSGKVNTDRATKVFDNKADAQARFVADGSTGSVIEYSGGVKACNYCSVRDLCSQYKVLKVRGLIK